MLMYPSIGCGIAAVRGKTKHMICCTRSGTVFIIPAHKAHQPISESTILTTSYPEDTDFDSPATYVQSFQAGNLLLKHGSERVKLPVLIFGWTNGIMDVYACRLLPSSLIEDSTTVAATQMKPTVPVEQQVLIEDCWENGSIELLFQLLEHLQDDPNNPLLRDPMWKAALAEFVELSDYPDSMVDVMMESEMYPAMRSTLLSLSTVSD
uniref:Uncharacterized protein n=1 Tax=Craspedostauros australis TaxID=1486917 RepID=A0A7R9ZL17_9STRA